MASAATAPQALSSRVAVRGARARQPRRSAVSIARRNTIVRAVITDPPKSSIKEVQRPDPTGRYGAYGGKYVPETLIPALQALEKEYYALASDEQFQVRHAHARKKRTTHATRPLRVSHAHPRPQATTGDFATGVEANAIATGNDPISRFFQTERTLKEVTRFLGKRTGAHLTFSPCVSPRRPSSRPS